VKITDDVRILVALREGLEVRSAYKQGYKWHAPEYLRCIEDTNDATKTRSISASSIRRAEQAGLIGQKTDSSSIYDMHYAGYDGHDIRFRLTKAGRSAAAALDVSLEVVMQRPVEKPAEERERDRIRSATRKVLKILVEEDRYLTACFRHGENCFWRFQSESDFRHYRLHVGTDVVAALAPYLETREDPNVKRR
jgi:hypothetical protein